MKQNIKPSIFNLGYTEAQLEALKKAKAPESVHMEGFATRLKSEVNAKLLDEIRHSEVQIAENKE